MLEIENYRENNFLSGPNFKREYDLGKRIGMITVLCKCYKKTMTSEDKVKFAILKDDTIEELNRFYNRYRNISFETMAKHIIRESEYMIDMH